MTPADAVRAISVLIAIVTCCPSCGTRSDTVFYPLSVEFVLSESESPENAEDSSIELVLNAPSDAPVVVSYEIHDLSASGHDDCGTRDYVASSGTVEFAPGETSQRVNLRHLDDDTVEIDEIVDVTIERVDGAVIGARDTHRHTILDDDRTLLVDVKRDFGALGDGETDDTQAVQAAIERASNSSGAVVLFPPGTYVLTRTYFAMGVNYYGYGATILQAPNQPLDSQLLKLDHSSDEDSEVVVLQGFTLDGNRDEQGPFEEHEYQDSDLLFVWGDPGRVGRLRLLMEDVTFRQTGGNGIWLDTNTDATLCQLRGEDVFTDMIKLGGGNSSLTARAIEGNGTVGTTGIALTGDVVGFGDSQAVDVLLDRVDLFTGDLEIDVQGESVVVGTQLDMSQAPFYLRAVRSSVHITDSNLVIGPPRFRYNRIIAPNDVHFENCRFVLSEAVAPEFPEPEQDRDLVVVEVAWDDVEYASSEDEQDRVVETLTDETLRFTDCEFEVADDVEASDVKYVAGSLGEPDPSNRVVLSGSRVSDAFDDVFAPGCGSCTSDP